MVEVKYIMRRPILVEIVSAAKESTRWDRVVLVVKSLLSLIRDFGSISAFILATLSFFPSGKSLIVDLFSLSDPEEPAVTQIEVQTETYLIERGLGGDLNPLGWSYLGMAESTEGWYYQALAGQDQSSWAGMIVEPTTAIYLLSEPVSAVNSDPVALTIIGNSETVAECLRIVNYRQSETGSIWLRGALIACP